MRRLMLILTLFACAARGALPAGTQYVMSHFATGAYGDRLYVSLSNDGLNWTALNNGQPVYQPENYATFNNVVRDPSIIYENGAYWVAHTSGTYGYHESFALVRSTDLLNWTFQREVSVARPGVSDPITWSPLWFRDGDGSVHVFVAMRPPNYPNSMGFRIQINEVHPVNADWSAWSAPVLVALPSNSTNEFWVWKEGTAYHAIYVDFNQGSAYIHATSSSLLTGWQEAQRLGFNTQEGAFLLRKPDGGYRLYSETGNGGSAPTYLYTDCAANFTGFTAQQSVTSSIGMRNGKPIAAPSGTDYATWAAALPAASRAANADADRDGVRNLAEFAMGRKPQAADAETGFSVSNGRLRFLRANGAEATLAPEVSVDLKNWYAGASFFTTLSTNQRSDGREEITVQDVSTFPAATRFYRLNATADLSSGGGSPSVQAQPAVQLRRVQRPLLPRRQRLHFDERPFIAK